MAKANTAAMEALVAMGFQGKGTYEARKERLLDAIPEPRRTEARNLFAAVERQEVPFESIYDLPRTGEEAALLFSQDFGRYLRNIEWLGEVIPGEPHETVVDFGCGAAHLLKFARDLLGCGSLIGIDVSANLLDVAQLVVEADYRQADWSRATGEGQAAWLMSNLGFDPAAIPDSGRPHSMERLGLDEYCPGCAQDLAESWEALLRIWTTWARPEAILTLMTRELTPTVLIGMVHGARAAGWEGVPEKSRFAVARGRNGDPDRFSCLFFRRSASPRQEGLAEFVASACGRVAARVLGR